MRLLGVLHLAVVAAWRRGHVVIAEHRRGLRARRRYRLVREGRGVGSHVGDPALLVESLGRAHRSFGIEAQFSTGFDLQRGGHERRLRALRAGRRGDGLDLEALSDQPLGQRGGRGGAQDFEGRLRHELSARVEVLARGERDTVDGVQSRLEGRVVGSQRRRDVVPRRRTKRHALTLTLTDQANRHRLHPPGRSRLIDRAPEHGRDLVAHETVEEPATFLGVHQAKVQRAGLGDGLGNGGRGDLVKDHALDWDLGVEHLLEVPRDGLALAVFVGGEVELVDFFEGRLQFRDNLLAVVRHDVDRFEVVVDVDTQSRPLLSLDRGGGVRGALGQVANVADRGLDDVVRSEHVLDAGRLGYRLNDDERSGHAHHLSGISRRDTLSPRRTAATQVRHLEPPSHAMASPRNPRSVAISKRAL